MEIELILESQQSFKAAAINAVKSVAQVLRPDWLLCLLHDKPRHVEFRSTDLCCCMTNKATLAWEAR